MGADRMAGEPNC